MKVSVIIPAYRRIAYIPELISTLSQQVFDDFEVIFVDDGSEPALKFDFPDARFQSIRHKKNLGPSEARNTGSREAKGDLILYCDNDVLPDPLWIRRMYDVWKQQPTSILYGAVVFGSSTYHSAFPERVVENVQSPWPLGANMGMGKGVWESLGGFDPAWDVSHNEDSELTLRYLDKGGKLIFVQEAIVVHRVETWTVRNLWKSRTNMGYIQRLALLYPHGWKQMRGSLWKSRWREVLLLCTLPISIWILLVRFAFRWKWKTFTFLPLFFTKWPCLLLYTYIYTLYTLLTFSRSHVVEKS